MHVYTCASSCVWHVPGMPPQDCALTMTCISLCPPNRDFVVQPELHVRPHDVISATHTQSSFVCASPCVWHVHGMTTGGRGRPELSRVQLHGQGQSG